MTDAPDPTDRPSTATAVAEPPGPPSAPPATGVASPPPPKRRRWLAWTIGILIALACIGALVGVVVWALNRGGSAVEFSVYQPGFDSAMAKAGTTATFPGAPVELDQVRPTGGHPFSATFSAEEITALVNVFRWTTDIQSTSVAVSGVDVTFPAEGTARLKASAKVQGNTYGGSLEGPAAFENGSITSSGATKVLAEGFPISGDRAKQATDMLLLYLNAYLDAAPGLTVYSAAITADGVEVSGEAPDSITLP